MAGKGGRRGGDVQLSKTARASTGGKGLASTGEWSRHHCDVCSEPIPMKDMVVVREINGGGDAMAHYHNACAGLPAAR